MGNNASTHENTIRGLEKELEERDNQIRTLEKRLKVSNSNERDLEDKLKKTKDSLETTQKVEIKLRVS